MKAAEFKTSLYDRLSDIMPLFDRGHEPDPDTLGSLFGTIAFETAVVGRLDNRQSAILTIVIDIYAVNAGQDDDAMDTAADTIRGRLDEVSFIDDSAEIYYTTHIPIDNRNIETGYENVHRAQLRYQVDYNEF